MSACCDADDFESAAEFFSFVPPAIDGSLFDFTELLQPSIADAIAADDQRFMERVQAYRYARAMERKAEVSS